jgi:putative SOS response-associated peptidase YedK
VRRALDEFRRAGAVPDGSRPPIWSAQSLERPLGWFAGIWTRWTSVRKVKEGEATVDAFGFLTCEPSEPVKTYHPKAMPVSLTKPEELDQWMSAPIGEALQLQRPVPDGALAIVARDVKQDEGEAAACASGAGSLHC